MSVFRAAILCLLLATQQAYVRAEYQSAGCSDEGCGIPCYLRPAEDDCHYTEHNPCDSGGASDLDDQLSLLNNSLVRLQQKLIQKGIIPAGNTCPPLPSIDNGGVIYSDLLLSIGVIANYVCTDGYSLHGHGRYECSVDGEWIRNDSQSITEKDVPVCEESLVVCAALVPIPFGHISYYIVDTTIVQPGDVASYSCDILYTLQGTEHRICLRNGTWSGMEPECVAPVTEQVKNSTRGSDRVNVAFGVLLPLIFVVAVIVVIVVVIVMVMKFRKKYFNKIQNSYQSLDETENAVILNDNTDGCTTPKILSKAEKHSNPTESGPKIEILHAEQ